MLGDCYVTCGVLGEGGFGRVLIVKQRATGRVLALKIMRKRALASGGPLAVEQALREREVLIKLARQPHPFIVRLHHAFQDVANLYLAMDYIGGGDIFDLLQRYGRVPLSYAVFAGASLCLALEHVHSMGVLYRDLKPENVLVAMSGHLVLADFGLAKCLVSHGDRTTTLCGTPAYMAPEMLRGEAYGCEVDWWAFGCVMYNLIAGRDAFREDAMDKLISRVRRGDYEGHRLDGVEHAGELIGALLQTNMEQRIGAKGLRDHPFFARIDFDRLVSRSLRPPCIPSAELTELDTERGKSVHVSRSPGRGELPGLEARLDAAFSAWSVTDAAGSSGATSPRDSGTHGGGGSSSLAAPADEASEEMWGWGAPPEDGTVSPERLSPPARRWPGGMAVDPTPALPPPLAETAAPLEPTTDASRAALRAVSIRAREARERSLLTRRSRQPSSIKRDGDLPSTWSADSVATPVDMQRELAPALRRWRERFVILYNMAPTRDHARAQIDEIIGELIPDTAGGIVQGGLNHLTLQNSV